MGETSQNGRPSRRGRYGAALCLALTVGLAQAPAVRAQPAALPIPAATIVAAADATLLTHLHVDHWDPVARALLPKERPILVQPADRDRVGGEQLADQRHPRLVAGDVLRPLHRLALVLAATRARGAR